MSNNFFFESYYSFLVSRRRQGKYVNGEALTEGNFPGYVAIVFAAIKGFLSYRQFHQLPKTWLSLNGNCLYGNFNLPKSANIVTYF